MRLIMLCGQGGIGKSTYGKWLVESLNNATLVRVDDFVNRREQCNETHVQAYIDKINTLIKENTYHNIIMDFSQDGPYSRAHILNGVFRDIPSENIKLVTISLRPTANKIIEWNKYKLKKSSTSRVGGNDKYFQMLQQIESIYNHFVYPTMEEFVQYNFYSVTNLIIDNSQPYQKLYLEEI